MLVQMESNEKAKKISPVAQETSSALGLFYLYPCGYRAPATHLASGNSQRWSCWWMLMEVIRSWSRGCPPPLLNSRDASHRLSLFQVIPWLSNLNCTPNEPLYSPKAPSTWRPYLAMTTTTAIDTCCPSCHTCPWGVQPPEQSTTGTHLRHDAPWVRAFFSPSFYKTRIF